MKISFITAGMASLALLVLGNAATAQTLFDDLSNPTNGSAPVQSMSTGDGLAASFSTGTASVSLTDVKLQLSASPSTSGFYINLFSDSGNHPSVLLDGIATVLDSSLSSTPTDVDFPLATAYPLAPDTRYWIELSSAQFYPTGPLTTALWYYTNTNSGTGVPNESYLYNSTVYPNSDGPDLMQVTATSNVPEPGAYALLAAFGITGAAFLRRKHSR